MNGYTEETQSIGCNKMSFNEQIVISMFVLTDNVLGNLSKE